MAHQDFINDMYQEYKSDKDDWISNPLIVQRAMEKYYNNPEAHYELLRLIIYKLEEGRYDREYLLFLKTLLFTLLEENAISLIYREKEKPEIYFNPGLNEILRKYPEIFLDDRGLSISNTQINQLIDRLEINSTIEKIKENRQNRRPSPYTKKKKGGKKRRSRIKRSKVLTRRTQRARRRVINIQ